MIIVLIERNRPTFHVPINHQKSAQTQALQLAACNESIAEATIFSNLLMDNPIVNYTSLRQFRWHAARQLMAKWHAETDFFRQRYPNARWKWPIHPECESKVRSGANERQAKWALKIIDLRFQIDRQAGSNATPPAAIASRGCSIIFPSREKYKPSRIGLSGRAQIHRRALLHGREITRLRLGILDRDVSIPSSSISGKGEILTPPPFSF